MVNDYSKISSRSVYSVALCGDKPQILLFFGLWHFVVSLVGGDLKAEQIFPYPTVSKSFQYCNAFIGKIVCTNSDVPKRE